MARAGSRGRRRARGALLDLLERLTTLGLEFGGLVFIITSGYLIWGIASGALDRLAASGDAARFNEIVWYMVIACKAMVISGVVVAVCAALRFYNHETTGYLLLIFGAAFYWGIPVLAGSSLPQMSSQVVAVIVYILAQYRIMGTVALATSIPFVLVDMWYRLSGIRRNMPHATVVIPKDMELPKSRFQIFCWQLPYCRDYLQKFCKPYECKKSCWRIKSGCYCDEDMMLKAMKRSATSKLPGFEGMYLDFGEKNKNLTAAQKRARCRKCFIYGEHQKQKYRLLSPLVFPTAVALMWIYYEPLRNALGKGLEFSDRFAGKVSFSTAPVQAVNDAWASSPATTGTIEWIFVACIGLILASYMLRALEFLIFDLQV